MLDYDDLLLYWAQMVSEPRLAADIGGRFDHVLVDEYQDTNRLQASILLALKPDGRGPDRGRRRRAVDLFLPRRDGAQHPRLSRRSSAPPAEIVTLDRNYRSTQPILAAANAVIELAARALHQEPLDRPRSRRERPQLVTVRDEADQARYVVEQVLENREAGTALKQQAVLFRTSHHSGPLEVELTRRNIPFVKFGGLKFLDAAHVKDVLALLRFAENPRDRVAGFRAAAAAARRRPDLGAAGARRDGGRRRSARRRLPTLPPPPRAGEDWPAFVDADRQLRARHGRLAGRARAGAPLVRAASRAHPRGCRDRARPISLQLEQIAAGYPSRERFLTELTLDPPDATSDQAGVPLLDEDYLILSTIHSAKGQEWKSVFVLNVVDGCIPSDLGTGTTAEIEEERRLLYVAMTRAKDSLHLIVPQRFFTHQQPPRATATSMPRAPASFPSALLKLFERVSWPVAVPDPASFPPR